MSSTKGISRGLESLTAINYAILAAIGFGVWSMGKKSAQTATATNQPQQQPVAVQGRPSFWTV